MGQRLQVCLRNTLKSVSPSEQWVKVCLQNGSKSISLRNGSKSLHLCNWGHYAPIPACVQCLSLCLLSRRVYNVCHCVSWLSLSVILPAVWVSDLERRYSDGPGSVQTALTEFDNKLKALTDARQVYQRTGKVGQVRT